MAIYRPRLVEQDDGSRLQWLNCTMASAAMALDRHTLGAIRTSGAKMRSCQDDQSGGTDLMDSKLAWDRCWNKDLDVRLKITWATFIGAVKAGRGAVVVGWYSYIPRVYRGQDNASFGHAVYINEVRASDGALLMYDPLSQTAKWIPQIYVKRFAGAIRFSGDSTLGYGYAQAAFTKITAATTTPTPTPTPTPTTTVTLKYGGVKITPNMYEAKVDAKQRRSPYIRTDNILRTVNTGTDFKAYQKTTTGTNVGGSATWYGNQYGTVWMHSSVLRDI